MFVLDGDGLTVLNLAGTGTTKFSGGLFRGVNSYFGALHNNIFGWIVLDGDGQTVLSLA